MAGERDDEPNRETADVEAAERDVEAGDAETPDSIEMPDDDEKSEDRTVSTPVNSSHVMSVSDRQGTAPAETPPQETMTAETTVHETAPPETPREETTPIAEPDIWSDLGGYRDRFDGLQAEFIDEPRAAVEKAEALISEAVKSVIDALNNRLSSIHRDLGDNTDDTEQLRLAMRSYRELMDSLSTRHETA